jgi:hypothetical protein
MVIDLFSEISSLGTSPRISFSRDFYQSDIVPVEHHPLRSNSSNLSNSSIDFDFCVRDREGFDQESSSVDELFSDRKIRPTQIKKKVITTAKQMDHQSPPGPRGWLAGHPPPPKGGVCHRFLFPFFNIYIYIRFNIFY